MDPISEVCPKGSSPAKMILCCNVFMTLYNKQLKDVSMENRFKVDEFTRKSGQNTGQHFPATIFTRHGAMARPTVKGYFIVLAERSYSRGIALWSWHSFVLRGSL